MNYPNKTNIQTSDCSANILAIKSTHGPIVVINPANIYSRDNLHIARRLINRKNAHHAAKNDPAKVTTLTDVGIHTHICIYISAAQIGLVDMDVIYREFTY